ncbi:MAG: winged helix DNA-binding domain-containing protein [Nonomuraea sp.]|nr:winged helix DNA-binding domain-containing protein [Nonomuraea sp.]
MRSVEAQLLHRPPGRTAGDVVRHLTALQAQDVPSALLAFRARSATLTTADVEAAWESREIVRTWGPRGTLHFMHAADLPWIHALTSSDVNAVRRLRQEGVTGDDLPGLAERVLAGEGPLTKAELEERLAGRARGQGVVHLVALAAHHGLAVLGPSRGGKPTYVHAGDWLGAPIVPEPDRGRALKELAVRYRRAHHPAGPEDLAAWSGLGIGEARAAWAMSAAAEPPEPPEAAEPFVRLAPAFDEYLMGWRDRSPILAAEHAAKVFPGGGILRPVVLAGGVIEGVWARKGTRASVEPFGELPRGPVQDEVADVHRFLSGR